VSFRAEENAAPIRTVIVEIQREPKDPKRLSWPAYLASARQRIGCDTLLLVVCPNRRTAAWCREPIHTGVEDWVLRPRVLGPDELPVVDDPGQAVASPFLAVLSTIVHGSNRSVRPKLYRAFAAVLGTLPDDLARKYTDIVYSAATGAARRELREVLMITDSRFQPSLVAEIHAEGEAEGEVRGLIHGKADAVLQILAARGIPVPEADRSTIEACDDPAQLDAWIRRAATADSIKVLFA
jgi:hypothetical protein